MIVRINGEDTELTENTSVQNLLDSRQISADTVVIELNRDILPSESFDETILKDGDHLEVLRFVGGG